MISPLAGRAIAYRLLGDEVKPQVAIAALAQGMDCDVIEQLNKFIVADMRGETAEE
jgi:hypothetical protein